MHVLLQTGLVAPQNVIFHPVGQLAPPKLGGFLLVRRNWCTHPEGPRAAVHTMEQGRHVHTRGDWRTLPPRDRAFLNETAFRLHAGA